MPEELKDRFPQLGDLSIAIIENLVEPIIGSEAIKVLKKPFESYELENKLGEVLIRTEKRWLDSLENKGFDNFAGVFCINRSMAHR